MRKGEKQWFDKYVGTHKCKKYKKSKTGQTKKKKRIKKNKETNRLDMVITREYSGGYYLHIPYAKKSLLCPLNIK
jgi:isocitrate/isopropylmalate dehydrogenase